MNATAAAKNVPYKITLYGDHEALIQEVTGTIDLPPSSTVPVLLLGAQSGRQKVTQAFLTIDSAAPKWFAMPSDSRVKPVVSNTSLGGAANAPRIDAVLSNASAADMTNVQVIIFVHDAQGEVIAASQTILPTIPAQGQTTATFTWSSAFRSVPSTIEVIPVIPLP
jgi:hypothetical protein